MLCLPRITMVSARSDRCFIGLVLLLLTPLVSQARPVEEDEELALSSLQGKVVSKDPVSPEEQTLLNSELEALKEHEAAKSSAVELAQEPEQAAEKDKNGEDVADEEEEEVEQDQPVDEGEISWADMGYSPESLRAIGNIVREVEHALLQNKIAAEQGRLRSLRQERAKKVHQGAADDKHTENVNQGSEAQKKSQEYPERVNTHTRRRRSTGVAQKMELPAKLPFVI